MTSHRNSAPRAPSPWSGSAHEVRLAWQLDHAPDLATVAAEIRELAVELRAAHDSGWWLEEPMRRGHLIAARASRRRRPAPRTHDDSPSQQAWRLRIIDEPAREGDQVLDLAHADKTPVYSWTGESLELVSGPAMPPADLADLDDRARANGLPPRLWGVARARVGDNLDLVAVGSAVRVHALQDGELVRTHEVLTFAHAADGATTLQRAACSYAEAAQEADQMAAAGGVLDSVDAGFVNVTYRRSSP